MKQLCGYGCGKNAIYSPRKGMKKWCCEKHYNKCPQQIKIKTERALNSGKLYGRVPWNKNTKGLQVAWNKGTEWNNKSIEKMKKSSKLTIKQINKRYPFFSKMENMRYDPDKLDEKEIQVHCKNTKCKYSKEKGGWFTPTYIQLYERIRQLEKDYGNDGSYLYCSDECKIECPLYYIFDDPFKKVNILYTPGEYKLWKHTVLDKDNYECQKCGCKINLNVHHIYPEKTYPHFALDPDNGITLCRKCHMVIGHRDAKCLLYYLRKSCQPNMGIKEL